MKRIVQLILSVIILLAGTRIVQAQTALSPGQNPNHQLSRDKYTRMSDSINAWHSTTEQETYKAIDYLENKREAKQFRKANRREMRRDMAIRDWAYGYDYYAPFYSNGYYRNYRRYHGGPYYNSGYRVSDLLWTALPLAIAVGLWWR